MVARAAIETAFKVRTLVSQTLCEKGAGKRLMNCRMGEDQNKHNRIHPSTSHIQINFCLDFLVSGHLMPMYETHPNFWCSILGQKRCVDTVPTFERCHGCAAIEPAFKLGYSRPKPQLWTGFLVQFGCLSASDVTTPEKQLCTKHHGAC